MNLAVQSGRNAYKFPMEQLKKFLGESGYKIFEADPSRRRTDDDIIVIHPDHPTTPLWLYQTPKGWIVIRPWSGNIQSRQLRRAVPNQYRSGLKLMRSRPMPPTADWRDWLSDKSKLEVGLLDLVN